MLRALTGLCLLGLASLASADAAPASQQALAQQYFKVAGIDRMYTDSRQIESMIDSQLTAVEANFAQRMSAAEVTDFRNVMAKVRPTINASVAKALTRMRPELVQVIAQTYSEKELKALIAFYDSVDGQTIVAKNPALMSAMMGVSGKYMGALMQDIQDNVVRVLQESAATGKNAPAGK